MKRQGVSPALAMLLVSLAALQGALLAIGHWWLTKDDPSFARRARPRALSDGASGSARRRERRADRSKGDRAERQGGLTGPPAARHPVEARSLGDFRDRARHRRGRVRRARPELRGPLQRAARARGRVPRRGLRAATPGRARDRARRGRRSTSSTIARRSAGTRAASGATSISRSSC